MITQTIHIVSFAALIVANTSAWADNHDKVRHDKIGEVAGIELGTQLSAKDRTTEIAPVSTVDRSTFKSERTERKVRIVYPAPNS